MRTLEIKAFSCIERASLAVKDLTIIIGPQASGKSVICKLYYFFAGIFGNLPRWLQDTKTPAGLKQRILEEFSDWFQPQTWGNGKFVLEYSSGPYVIKIARAVSRGDTPRARLSLSDAFEELLVKISEAYQKAGIGKDNGQQDEFDVFFKQFNVVRKLLETSMGANLPEDLLYIPAGRSFFTSIGKIVAAFEDRTLLDPVVHDFGRLVTNLRESSFYEREVNSPLLKTVEALLGGKVLQERGRQYLATNDGRSVPFSALSSGQQELLPLLYALRFVLWRDRPSLTFVEEPEAHLFPSAQISLVEMFAQMVVGQRRRAPGSKASSARSFVLTTHSPYVLAKINNLIKAGQLAKRIPNERRKELESVVPASSWINPDRVAAYAIEDRKLIGILDEYGLVNGDYIDAVSEVTGIEFDSLLDIEAKL